MRITTSSVRDDVSAARSERAPQRDGSVVCPATPAPAWKAQPPARLFSSYTCRVGDSHRVSCAHLCCFAASFLRLCCVVLKAAAVERARKREAEGAIRQCNEAKLEFRFEENRTGVGSGSSGSGDIVLEVAVPKYLDSSLIDLDVHPHYVSVVIKGKVSVRPPGCFPAFACPPRPTSSSMAPLMAHFDWALLLSERTGRKPPLTCTSPSSSRLLRLNPPAASRHTSIRCCD